MENHRVWWPGVEGLDRVALDGPPCRARRTKPGNTRFRRTDSQWRNGLKPKNEGKIRIPMFEAVHSGNPHWSDRTTDRNLQLSETSPCLQQECSLSQSEGDQSLPLPAKSEVTTTREGIE